jgi:hypothetical protein
MNTILCAFLGCQKPFSPSNKRQRFCSGRCRAANSYFPTKQAVQVRKNTEFASRNCFRSLGVDGRYGGPGNSCSGFVSASVVMLTEQQRLSLAKTNRRFSDANS